MSTEYDINAIYKAYPEVKIIDGEKGIFTRPDPEGDLVNVTDTIEESKVAAARVELDKLNYRTDRADAYPRIGDQLDSLYKDIVAGKVDSTGEFATAIKKVKDDNPKT